MPDLRPYSCLRSLGIIAVYIAALSSSILASRTCPRGCICNDQQLIARCDKSAQLDYVPHTLNPSVKELYLSHNNIRGIKSAFDLYKNLILLDLASNNLQMLGEKNFIANSRMETILLMYNNISDIQPNTFSGLFALKKLDLSYNLIEALNGTTFQQLKALQFLDLSFNNIRALNKDAFTGLHNLVHLNISNNLIVKFTFDLFQHVPNLLSLNSSFNQLESLDDDQFNPLPKLTSLDLSNCYINKVDKFAFRGMNNLRHIFLDGNYLEVRSFIVFFSQKIIYFYFRPFHQTLSWRTTSSSCWTLVETVFRLCIPMVSPIWSNSNFCTFQTIQCWRYVIDFSESILYLTFLFFI